MLLAFIIVLLMLLQLVTSIAILWELHQQGRAIDTLCLRLRYIAVYLLPYMARSLRDNTTASKQLLAEARHRENL